MGDYGVFLNHHGPDTKFGFASHLAKALTHERLKPFLDLPSLKAEAGFHVPTIIRNALEVVKVNVAVVSKGYASSAYCLDELVIMMKSNREVQKPVIPVLYDVQFNDLRWHSCKSGLFAGAFKHHRRSREQDIVTEWAVALDDLSNISGFSKANYQDEASLIDDVVACVKKHMEQRAYKDQICHPVYDQILRISPNLPKHRKLVKYGKKYGKLAMESHQVEVEEEEEEASSSSYDQYTDHQQQEGSFDNVIDWNAALAEPIVTDDVDDHSPFDGASLKPHPRCRI